MAEETPKSAPAYIPWKTFTNTLDALAAHMPNRIDKSAFPGQSGAVQNQLMLAFRFFGLIADDGKPTSTLMAITVSDDAARKAALRKLIEQKYAELFALNLLKTTPAEFAEKMTSAYNVTGDTRIKATRFFLAACQYLDVAVSPLLMRDRTKPVGNGPSVRKRRPRNRAEELGTPATEDEGPPAAESRSVTLRSGGTLTLSATTKFMALSTTDRRFVFDLIDKLEEYETQGGLQTKED